MYCYEKNVDGQLYARQDSRPNQEYIDTASPESRRRDTSMRRTKGRIEQQMRSVRTQCHLRQNPQQHICDISMTRHISV